MRFNSRLRRRETSFLAVSGQLSKVKAQIAGFADHHYSVEKRTEKGRAVVVVEELTRDKRTREIDRMLSS